MCCANILNTEKKHFKGIDINTMCKKIQAGKMTICN